MASSFTITIARDGMVQIHAATLLFDLLEDFEYFRAEAAKVDRKRDLLVYKRFARAATVSFYSYFDGVLIRWIAKFDPDFRSADASVGAKLKRVRQEINKSRGRHFDFLDTARLSSLRNKIVHLNLVNDDAEVAEELLAGSCFDQAQQLLNWLKIAGHRLGLDLHDDPNKLMQPYIEALGGRETVDHSPLSEEDEELVHIAEMTFLELDAREAADGKP